MLCFFVCLKCLDILIKLRRTKGIDYKIGLIKFPALHASRSITITQPSGKGRKLLLASVITKSILFCQFNTFQKWLFIVYMNEVLLVSLSIKCQAYWVLQKRLG